MIGLESDVRTGDSLDTSCGESMNSFSRDFVFGVRMLRKSPGFTLVAVLSLAVGIGVNSTVFGFVNAIFFKPISVPHPEGLVYVFAGDLGNPYRNSSYVNYLEFRKQNDVFSGLAAHAAPPVRLTTGEHTEEINAEVVSGNYFSVLDVPLQRGRSFTLDDEQISLTEPGVVISDAFWKRRFSSAPDILQKKSTLNGNSFSVIGVASGNFSGVDPSVSTDVWIPIPQGPP
jgi:putative ABC transport system permease protein